METETRSRINQLLSALPEGLLADAAWLKSQGYKTTTLSKYVAAGYLEHPAREVYRRPRGTLTWQQVVISLQTLLYRTPLAVGGRTALEMQGYTHYLRRTTKDVHLYGPSSPPSWLDKLPSDVHFVFHNSTKLFAHETQMPPKAELHDDESKQRQKAFLEAGFVVSHWGQWDWPLVSSTPERALLELLDEVPARETFEQADKLFAALTNLRPGRMQRLLERCRSVKAKRLFFYFSDRHQHAWANQINKSSVDLGKGKRMLVKGGILDRAYQITVPKDLDADN